MAHWGFEDDDDEPAEQPADEEPLTGQDVDEIVTIGVDDAGTVRSVRLADGWQDEFRRSLGVKVVEALTAATTRAMAKQTGRPETPATLKPTQDSPLTSDDVLQLLHAVSADLDRFRRRLSAVADEPLRVTSGGGHVTVAGRRRQVADVSMDQDWLYGARASEVGRDPANKEPRKR